MSEDPGRRERGTDVPQSQPEITAFVLPTSTQFGTRPGLAIAHPPLIHRRNQSNQTDLTQPSDNEESSCSFQLLSPAIPEAAAVSSWKSGEVPGRPMMYQPRNHPFARNSIYQHRKSYSMPSHPFAGSAVYARKPSVDVRHPPNEAETVDEKLERWSAKTKDECLSARSSISQARPPPMAPLPRRPDSVASPVSEAKREEADSPVLPLKSPGFQRRSGDVPRIRTPKPGEKRISKEG